MLQRLSTLSLVAGLILPVVIAGGRADAAIGPIQAIKGVTPKPSIFRAATRNKPLSIRSEEDAAAHFPQTALATLKKQVDFTQQTVLVFAWRGSGQDRLTYAVAESFPEQVFFKFRPGRTRDLRPHMRIFALRSNVKWRGPDGKAFGGGKAATAPADKKLAAAKKHPKYKRIYEAKNVVIAKLTRAEVTSVAESYPAIYNFKLTLEVEEVLRGALKSGKLVQCSYSKTGKKQPLLPVGKKCLVLLHTDRNRIRAHHLAQTSDELLNAARIAVEQANKADKAAAKLAAEKPEKHPLYALLKKADGVIVATGDMEGTSSHSSSGGSSESEICVVSMKGKLKRGDRFEAAFPASVAPNGKMPASEFTILGYKLVAGKYRATCVAEASDTNLRIAAAATKTKPLTLKDIGAIKLPRTRRAKSSGSSGESTEPQSGQSTPSEQ